MVQPGSWEPAADKLVLQGRNCHFVLYLIRALCCHQRNFKRNYIIYFLVKRVLTGKSAGAGGCAVKACSVTPWGVARALGTA